MTIREAANILGARIAWGDEELLDTQVLHGCSSDLMSDVLAFVKNQSVLLTGLVNPQVVRTAEMMDMICIIFTRGKHPDEGVIELAKQYRIVLLCTDHRMFAASGLLYENGLRGGDDI